MADNFNKSEDRKKEEKKANVNKGEQMPKEPGLSSSQSNPETLKPKPQEPARPPDNKDQGKEPWQYNEDLKEKLANVSPEFAQKPLAENEKKKPLSPASIPVSDGSQGADETKKKEPKILTSVHEGSIEKKRLGHHPVSLFILLGVFGFGLAALLFSVLSKPSAKKTAPKPEKETPAAEIISPAAVLAEDQQKPTEEIAEEEEELSVGQSMPSIHISGIIFDEKAGGLALINGKVVREGYMVDGVKLERVYSDKVEMSFEGKKFILRAR